MYRFAESVGITTFKYANNMRLTKQQTQCFFELGHNSFESWVSDVSLDHFAHLSQPHVSCPSYLDRGPRILSP